MLTGPLEHITMAFEAKFNIVYIKSCFHYAKLQSYHLELEVLELNTLSSGTAWPYVRQVHFM